MRVAIPALAGMTTLHALLPPHPGPLIAVGALHADLGTTMLLADRVDLAPAYGGASAVAHRTSGAHPLGVAVPDARADVDTLADLAATLRPPPGADPDQAEAVAARLAAGADPGGSSLGAAAR